MERQRITFLASIFALLTLVVVGRLYVQSIGHHATSLAQAKEQQNVERDILPRRGTVYVQDYAAKSTTVVAESVERFAFSATPRNVEHKDEFAAALAPVLGVDEAQVAKAFNRDSLYMDPLVHGLTKDQVDKVAATIVAFERRYSPKMADQKVNYDNTQGQLLYFLNGTFFIQEYERVYPEGGLLGQTLGFVDDKGEGKYGIEGQYDNELRGYEGRVSLEKDSLGNLLSQTGAIQGQDGSDFELTIDRNVQYYIETALQQEVQASEAEGGSVIVMNPQTGDVLGMASTPSYDPTTYQQTAKDNISLFDNPTISKQWEPGSIFKPIIMSAALDTGTVTPDTANDFPESVTVQGYKIETALRKSYGHETMTDVIANSDNVGMVWVSNLLGNEKMADYIKKFGFGSTTGVDLRNEISGSMTPVSQWQDINRATMSFGQGIAVTPLQIIDAYTAIANKDGSMVKPRLVKAIIHSDGTREELAPSPTVPVIKPETAAEMRDMLVATITQHEKKAQVAGYVLGGKTGTAQIPNPSGPGYIDNAYNHSFVGMGPIDNPQFIILTKIDHPNVDKVGLFAESTSVPLFRQIANFLLDYYQIPPTN